MHNIVFYNDMFWFVISDFPCKNRKGKKAQNSCWGLLHRKSEIAAFPYTHFLLVCDLWCSLAYPYRFPGLSSSRWSSRCVGQMDCLKLRAKPQCAAHLMDQPAWFWSWQICQVGSLAVLLAFGAGESVFMHVVNHQLSGTYFTIAFDKQWLSWYKCQWMSWSDGVGNL